MRISDWSSDVCSSDLETHELMDARRIGLLEPSAYVINTSRGVIVDEGALVEALEAQRIAGAGLDVYRHEPEIDPLLLALSNVVRSEERRVGKECVSTCRSRWWTNH